MVLNLCQSLLDWAARRQNSRSIADRQTAGQRSARQTVQRVDEAEMLRHQLWHDEMTGLPNRRFLQERLAHIAHTKSSVPHGLAVLILDLDRFKPVNELYGKETGDHLLHQAGRRMQNLIAAPDIVARIGGDKFAILHHASGQPEDALALAETLIRALGEVFEIDGQRVAIGASAGIAIYPPEGMAADTLLRDADTALQYARAQGGGRPCLFETEMRRQQQARRQMEHDFRLAIEARQFIVHYQPLFESGDISLSGFEALVRWQHPTRGLVSPAEFIPFAEKSGLVTALGLFVLETACADAALWPDNMRISVNISPVQLRAGDLVDSVAEVLRKTGLPAHRLELEITEGALIENPEQAGSVLGRLKELGVQITIDDFGTGYSSLSYLRHFRFDRIKIDRSFIENLEADANSQAIVGAIINLGHALLVGVLAEGIETTEQLQLLRRQNCDQLQGYLLGRPGPIAGAVALVETQMRNAARPASRSVAQPKSLPSYEHPEPPAPAATSAIGSVGI